MKKIVLFILLISSGISIQAQTKKWTLRECVEYALENNISVKQSELDLDLTEMEKSDAIGNFLPSLNGSASNAWNTGLTQDVTTGVLANRTNRNSSYSMTLGMNLFQGLRNYKIYQRSELSKLAADYGLSKMKDDISLFVANAYLQVLNNKANLDVLQSQNEVTLQQIERTNELVDAGVLPKGDLLEIRATDASEKQNIAITENAVRISLISLAQLLRIQDYENFDIEDEGYEIIDEGITAKDIAEIIASAKENRSELKLAQTNYDLAEKDVQISRTAYVPTLSVYMNYNTRESDVPSGREVELDPDNPVIVGDTPIGVLESTGESVLGLQPNILSVTELGPLPFFEQLYLNDGISYGFQLRVPIFNGFSTRNTVKRSLINVKRQEYLLEQTKLDIESNVYQAYVDAKGSYKSFEAAQKALESQELAYQYAKDRYDVGLINAFDFSQSKTRYDNAKIEANRSKYDYIFKLKVLELYFGVPASELKF